MTQNLVLAPKKLFEDLKADPSKTNWSVADEAYKKFCDLKNKSHFLEPAIEFMDDMKSGEIADKERADQVRSWGPQVLSWMKDNATPRAFDALFSLLKDENTPDLKKDFLWTRFRAIHALWRLAERSKDGKMKKRLSGLLDDVAYDTSEGYANQAISLLLIAQYNNDPAETKRAVTRIKEMLSITDQTNVSKNSQDTPALGALNALKEVPLDDAYHGLTDIMENSPHYLLRTTAVQALGVELYKQDELIYKLGLVVKTNSDHYMRKLAVASLGNLGTQEAQRHVIEALLDIDGEVRIQAAKALVNLCGKDCSKALRIVAQEAMRKGVKQKDFELYTDALRYIDKNKDLCAKVLTIELDGSDPDRAKLAQRILADVGGLASFQKLSRRLTLENSYKVLENSEQNLTTSFANNTRQAVRGFNFAMGVNISIVAVGIALVGIAIWQVTQTPQNFASWLAPGAGGLFGIILTMYFNGPRKNAQQDLGVLVSANVIYLGFLRMINEIDATFKHDYIENSNFNINDTLKAVRQISIAMKTTLECTSNCLLTNKEIQENIKTIGTTLDNFQNSPQKQQPTKTPP